MAHVMTVQGPINPADLGPTMTHEHIFVDSRHAWSPSPEILDPEAATRPFEVRLAGSADGTSRPTGRTSSRVPTTTTT